MVEIPEILKGTAQINFIEDASINIMDLETYESVDVNWPADEELKQKIKDLQKDPGKMSLAQVEYWQLAGKTLINRVIIT
jgi:translation elongation factor P/translation initiation factor 5A